MNVKEKENNSVMLLRIKVEDGWRYFHSADSCTVYQPAEGSIDHHLNILGKVHEIEQLNNLFGL